MVVETEIPSRIGRIRELSHNLWWSWHEEARQMFRSLDYPVWRASGHNPVKQLSDLDRDTLEDAANDPGFLKLYDSVLARFDHDMTTSDTWLARHYPHLLERGPVAYFSMEYAIHNSLPMYAGGLGVLAGDICKEASDLGIPMVAVGFMYPQGYFHQHIAADGWQQEIYQQIDFEEAPVRRVLSPDGLTALASVRMNDATVAVGVWEVRVGRTRLFLLDTNLQENSPEYRELSARLYIADRELRIQQEIVLGIGGVRVLRALGLSPVVWHANEGHNSFMMLERIRESVAAGLTFDAAVDQVKATSVFTTHTPVGAGHDVFPDDLVQRYLDSFRQQLGIEWQQFFELGREPGTAGGLNMTVLALRLADKRSAVSELHAKVANKMWQRLWPGQEEGQAPITHVTNGVHVPTWIGPPLHDIIAEYCGHDWYNPEDSAGFRDRLLELPDTELWSVHQRLKNNLLNAVRDRMRARWIDDRVPLQQVLAMGATLDAATLTIGFARRFAEYKRPTLIFRDRERLRRIVNNPTHPVQIIFAGKSHAADFQSKCFLQQVYTLATQAEFQGRIVFVEEYDIRLAHALVRGVDVWLNNPRRLHEACGTSGMKASINGIPQLSVLDGWWREGYNGTNGWAIGPGDPPGNGDEEDRLDAESIYDLLEKEVVPLYYKRDRDGIPHAWVRRMKETIASVIPDFCAQRMLRQYLDLLYSPLIDALEPGKRPGAGIT